MCTNKTLLLLLENGELKGSIELLLKYRLPEYRCKIIHYRQPPQEYAEYNINVDDWSIELQEQGRWERVNLIILEPYVYEAGSYEPSNRNIAFREYVLQYVNLPAVFYSLFPQNELRMVEGDCYVSKFAPISDFIRIIKDALSKEPIDDDKIEDFLGKVKIADVLKPLEDIISAFHHRIIPKGSAEIQIRVVLNRINCFVSHLEGRIKICGIDLAKYEDFKNKYEDLKKVVTQPTINWSHDDIFQLIESWRESSKNFLTSLRNLRTSDQLSGTLEKLSADEIIPREITPRLDALFSFVGYDLNTFYAKFKDESDRYHKLLEAIADEFLKLRISLYPEPAEIKNARYKLENEYYGKLYDEVWVNFLVKTQCTSYQMSPSLPEVLSNIRQQLNWLHTHLYQAVTKSDKLKKEERQSPRKRIIVWVDDDFRSREISQRYEKEIYQKAKDWKFPIEIHCLASPDEKQVLKKIKTVKNEKLLILDVVFGSANLLTQGVKIYKTIRQRYPDLPIIFFTVSRRNEAVVEVFGDAYAEFVSKENFDLLANKIQNFLKPDTVVTFTRDKRILKILAKWGEVDLKHIDCRNSNDIISKIKVQQKASDIKLFILDITMFGETIKFDEAIKVIDCMSKDNELKGIPIIVLTDTPDADKKEEYVKLIDLAKRGAFNVKFREDISGSAGIQQFLDEIHSTLQISKCRFDVRYTITFPRFYTDRVRKIKDIRIPEDEIKGMVKELTQMSGGATIIDAKGTFISEAGKIISDDNLVISICTRFTPEKKRKLSEWCLKMRQKYQQEVMFLQEEFIQGYFIAKR